MFTRSRASRRARVRRDDRRDVALRSTFANRGIRQAFAHQPLRPSPPTRACVSTFTAQTPSRARTETRAARCREGHRHVHAVACATKARPRSGELARTLSSGKTAAKLVGRAGNDPATNGLDVLSSRSGGSRRTRLAIGLPPSPRRRSASRHETPRLRGKALSRALRRSSVAPLIAPRAPRIGRGKPREVSPAPADPRVGLIAALSTAVQNASSSGDLAAARVALDALNRLMTDPTAVSASPVIELAERRRSER